MEQGPHHPEGGEQPHETNETHETGPEPIFEQLTAEQHIQRGITEALNEGRVIDDEIARLIALRLTEQINTGQDSALSAFASSGELLDRREHELLESVQDVPVTQDSWIDALLDYADGRVRSVAHGRAGAR